MGNLVYYDQGYEWLGGGNVYPGTYDSIALQAGAETSNQFPVSGSGQPVSTGSIAIAGANPIVGLVIFGGFTIGLMLAIEHGFLKDKEGDFSNPTASVYSVLFISAIAKFGGPLWDLFFTALAHMGIPFTANVAAYMKG